MSSSHFTNPLRGFITNLRRRFHHQQPSSVSSFSSSFSSSSSSSAQQDETTHYEHGIPGIPTDGQVVLLKNSNNGSQIHLVGTFHVSKQSAETVKKVINYVQPDSVAIEMCKGRAEALMSWKPKDDTLYQLFRKSMRAPGGLCAKIYFFAHEYFHRRLEADGIFFGLEFKVAMEESSSLGASCFYIDKDINVMVQQFSKRSSFGLLREAFALLLSDTKWPDKIYTRASVREMLRMEKKHNPKTFEVMTEDRDKFMFTNLRSLQGKVVAVVGMGHMDGIELLWKQAEEDDSIRITIPDT